MTGNSQKSDIQHVPNRVINISLEMLPYYLEKNGLEPVKYVYGTRSQEHILLVKQKEAEEA